MIESIIHWIEGLSETIPLPLFVVLGSFLEEIIAPIPSPLVMTSAGTIIHAREQTVLYILFIAVVGAASKTVSSIVLYIFSDKIEDLLVSRFGKLLRISHKNTEGIGKHFNNTRRDDILLFFLRAIPLFPNAPISILCGIIKLNMKTYITATFAGTIIKNLIYIYAGVLSLNYLESFKSSYQLIEALGYLLLILLTGYFISRHQKSRGSIKKLIRAVGRLLKR